MSAGTKQARGASPFSRGAVLAVVVVGFAAFLAMIYFIGIGDTGGREGRGEAHASANGLNGYAGLVELLEAEGYDVERSRDLNGLETNNLLILTPPQFTDAAEFGQILENRQYLGPTLVILPKWSVGEISGDVADEDEDKVRSDWVTLLGASTSQWTAQLPEPFTFTHEQKDLPAANQASWSGLAQSGRLPTGTVLYVENDASYESVIRDPAGHILAMNVIGNVGTDYYENAHWTMFVVEPDLVNNYGLSDARRAAAALALVQEAGYGDMNSVTFDMTLNGYGNSVNLLTLAFEPPFLAATLCLILAMVIVGWRAFLRFGPSAVAAPEFAFGKKRLVTNGAGLIVRARRLGLLGEPYANLIERRLGRKLGLVKPDAEAIDAALARRLPNEEPFSNRAARLLNAERPAEILRAARALNELPQKLATPSTGKNTK